MGIFHSPEPTAVLKAIKLSVGAGVGGGPGGPGI